jgi:cardiolipin synthase
MLYLALAGAVFLAWLVLVVLFTPGINYRVRSTLPVDSAEFVRSLEAICQAAVHPHNNVHVLVDGSRFYPAMLEAIRGATRSICLECYIFRPGRTVDAFVKELVDRARAGVAVNIVLDAIGSANFSGEPYDRLREAGCQVVFYRPVRWYSLARLNNRTHRELLIVDGLVAFIGGAGVADSWDKGDPGEKPWRDLMARVEGPIVGALQGVFMENWLECEGEILNGPEYFPEIPPRPSDGTVFEASAPALHPAAARGSELRTDTTAFVLKSSPADRATVCRVAFQLLIENAGRELAIVTPYFLPDRALRRALVDAASRGASIQLLLPGRRTDQRWVRLASRRLYGELLEAGIRIREYGPAMLHVKLMIVDRRWSILGTTNLDNRSFEHNDEVNIAMLDPGLAEGLMSQFQQLAAGTREITMNVWQQRPLWEKVVGPFVWFLERQQ